MTREELLAGISQRFGESVLQIVDRSPARVYIEIDPAVLPDLARHLVREVGARFNIASGLETPACFEILYHFTIERLRVLVSLRVKLDKSAPRIDSLAPLFKGANWIEREMHELLGIDFRGHPNLERLLLPEQWPEGVHPLRRDYREWDASAVRDRGV
jgi:NADH-quinone oxidoreductase subunit C